MPMPNIRHYWYDTCHGNAHITDMIHVKSMPSWLDLHMLWNMILSMLHKLTMETSNDWKQFFSLCNITKQKFNYLQIAIRCEPRNCSFIVAPLKLKGHIFHSNEWLMWYFKSEEAKSFTWCDVLHLVREKLQFCAHIFIWHSVITKVICPHDQHAVFLFFLLDLRFRDVILLFLLDLHLVDDILWWWSVQDQAQ